MNRGKRAITLDLTVPDGVALAKALIKDADAVIETYSAEVLRKFGLDYDELVKVRPSLVMVSMAAFGVAGPWRETRAYGSTLEQGSGLPSVGGRADDPPMMNHLAYLLGGKSVGIVFSPQLARSMSMPPGSSGRVLHASCGNMSCPEAIQPAIVPVTLLLAVALAILLTALAFNALGESLRVALDPTMKLR
jgi:hypothetical protein